MDYTTKDIRELAPEDVLASDVYSGNRKVMASGRKVGDYLKMSDLGTLKGRLMVYGVDTVNVCSSVPELVE